MKALILTISTLFITFISYTQCNIQANFTYQQIGDSMYFTDASTNTTLSTAYSWNFGGLTSSDTNPVFNTSNFGGYISTCVTLVDSSFMPTCYSSACDSIFITPDTTCNLNISFYAYENNDSLYILNTTTGTPAGGGYQWLVNGTLTSSDINPVFSSAGLPNPVNICLAVNDYQNGTCQDSICNLSYYVDSSACNLQASFTYSMTGDSIDFVSTSLNTDANTTYGWNFNNVVSYDQYSSFSTNGLSGYYITCLTITDPNMNPLCSSEICDSIYIAPDTTCNVQANFTYTISGDSITFTNTSTNEPLNSEQDWWINGYSYVGNTVQIPTSDSILQVCLTVGFDYPNWCYDTFCDTITIANDSSACNLQASFTYSMTGDSIDFVSTSLNTDANTTYGWNFNNVVSYDQYSSFSTNGLSGYYITCLTITDPNMNPLCSSEICDSIYIAPDTTCNVQANFTYTISGDSITFTNTSTNEPLNSEQDWWINGYSYVGNTVQIPTSDSILQVCLTVGFDYPNWCYDTFCDTITIANDSSLTIGLDTFKNLTIYPNPFNANLTIRTSSYENSKIIIYNYIGETILEQNITNTITEVKTDLLPNGIYLIKVLDISSNYYIIKKVVKQ